MVFCVIAESESAFMTINDFSGQIELWSKVFPKPKEIVEQSLLIALGSIACSDLPTSALLRGGSHKKSPR
jgi:hypothetical protein